MVLHRIPKHMIAGSWITKTRRFSYPYACTRTYMASVARDTRCAQRRITLVHGFPYSKTIVPRKNPEKFLSHVRRCGSSSSRWGNSEHDRKVIAAQSRVLERLEKRLQALPPVLQREVSTPEERVSIKPDDKLGSLAMRWRSSKMSQTEHKVVLQAVQYWLSKDPSFFVSTMEALDLNQQVGNMVNKNANDNNLTRRLQAVRDHHRQLYYNSISEFVNELERGRKIEQKKGSNQHYDNGKNNNIRLMLERLKAAGFGDLKWSRRYRQVRGYKINQDQLTMYMIRKNMELEQRREALAKTLKSKQNLEENLARKKIELSKFRAPSSKAKIASITDVDANVITYDYYKNRAISTRHQNKKDLENSNQEREESENVIKTTEDKAFITSFFERTRAFISYIWRDPKPTVQPNINTETNMRKNGPSISRKEFNAPFADGIDGHDIGCGEKHFGVFNPFERPKKPKNTTSRLLKRIERKELTVSKLQQEIDALSEKLQQIERSKAKSKPPIPSEEYEHVRVVVAEFCDFIGEEFSKYIKKRHNTSIQQYQALDSKTDLTKPHEWYPHARSYQRKIIFHGGPTNSGKTYSALQRLKEAKKGLYLGPLRLLAAEVYETLTAEGFHTNLFTGQERREVAFSTHTSATVEMCDVTEEYDIVVIDEIQMIANPSRGSAWSKALMGLRCKEIHVCGGLEAMDIVKKITDMCGDDFESKRYYRFSDLKVSRSSLSRNPRKRGSYQNVQPGDCVVAFNRKDIFAIKREIESMTEHKCCVIYGKLPPKIRADEAKRFNDPDSGYEVLVASDAIGMGLNLDIRRIIFHSIFKFNGEKVTRLSHSEIKQISGRAGRRNSPYQNGKISCRDHRDLSYIRKCISNEIEPLRKAALVPTVAHIELFAEAIHAYTSNNSNESGDGESYSYPDLHEILQQFSAMATVKGDFFIGRQNEMAAVAKRLKKIPIRLRDAYTMCLAPSAETSPLLEIFATKVSRGETFGLPSRPVPKKAKSFDDLSRLCNIYADVDLFMWLQFKFHPLNDIETANAVARKELTMEYINDALSVTEQLKLNHCYLKMANRHRSVWEIENGEPGNNGFYEVEEGNIHDDYDNPFCK